MVGKSEGKVAESSKAAANLSKGTHDGILCFGLLVVVNEIAMALWLGWLRESPKTWVRILLKMTFSLKRVPPTKVLALGIKSLLIGKMMIGPKIIGIT